MKRHRLVAVLGRWFGSGKPFYTLLYIDSMMVRMVYQTKVTDKYQITIPKKLRDVYGVKRGSKVSLIPRETGIELLAAKKIENITEKLYGSIKFKGDPVKHIHNIRSNLAISKAKKS